MMWSVTLGSLVLYLLIGSSKEFAPFAPYAVHGTWLYIGCAAAAFTTGLITVDDTVTTRFLTIILIFAVPILIYGTALVLLWTSIGGRGLVDYFAVQAVRRVLTYLFALGAVGLFGGMLGCLTAELWPQ